MAGKQPVGRRNFGSWQLLQNAPSFSASTMLLLTDGTVMCQETMSPHWWRLAPTSTGDYWAGTWSMLPPMSEGRLYYASAVLADGRVFVAGGEYNGAGQNVDLNTGDVFDPVNSSWTPLLNTPGWARIGDAPCAVLPNGRLLLGSIDSQQTAIFDPAAGTWTSVTGKDDSSSEETWTLLQDGSVLVPECTNHPKAEKFITPECRWVAAQSLAAAQPLPVDLVEASSIEIGPAIALPSGHIFAIGASGQTAIYWPPFLANQPGVWTDGPTFPKDASGRQLAAKDAPACLLPSGDVLCTVGPVTGLPDDYLAPTSFFLFDGAGLNPIPPAPNSLPTSAPYEGRMLLLPTGQVLFSNGTSSVAIYTPDGQPDPNWAPLITSCPTILQRGNIHPLQGIQLNGISQACSYGDDASMATNYPIVRLIYPGTGQVAYCRTFGHSSMGIQPAASSSTAFVVPITAPVGPAQLVVVANGISSQSLNVTVA
jgi:hypothetical protein